MSSKISRKRGKAALIAATLLGIGAAATPSLAGDRAISEAQLFGQIVVSLLGASQPQAVHYHKHGPSYRHARRAWSHHHAGPPRDCTVVTRIVTDRFGRHSRVVTRHCDDRHNRRHHHRRWH